MRVRWTLLSNWNWAQLARLIFLQKFWIQFISRVSKFFLLQSIFYIYSMLSYIFGFIFTAKKQKKTKIRMCLLHFHQLDTTINFQMAKRTAMRKTALNFILVEPHDRRLNSGHGAVNGSVMNCVELPLVIQRLRRFNGYAERKFVALTYLCVLVFVVCFLFVYVLSLVGSSLK